MRWIILSSLLGIVSATALRGHEVKVKVYFRQKELEGRPDVVSYGCTDTEIRLLRQELVPMLSATAYGSCGSTVRESVCFHASPMRITEYRRLRLSNNGGVNLEVPAFSRRLSTFEICRNGVHTVRMAVVEAVALVPVSAQCVISFQEAAAYDCV